MSSPEPPPSRPSRARAARLLLVLGCVAAPAGPVAARLVRADLARVAAAPAPGARVPLDLDLTDAQAGGPTLGPTTGLTTLGRALGDRPALLLPVDYTCGNVCDPMLSLSVDALAATGLPPGDARLILVGIDPRDDAGAARRMLSDTLGERGPRPQALIASEAAVARLTTALGYTAVYDRGTDSFAHPAAAMLLTGDGRVARVLSPLALNGRDLRLALTEAGEGRVGGFADRLALLCYGYDAERGVYTPLVRRIVETLGVATVLGIGLLVFALRRSERRRAG